MEDSSPVFISYSADTRALAEELTLALQREGIQAWADFKDLKPGQLFQEEIENALDKARSFVILVSPHSQSTRWSELEWRLALTKAWSDSDKVLIPVVVGGNEAPPFLRHWVAVRIDPGNELPRWTSQILSLLRSPGNRTVQGLSGRDQLERRKRFDEMAHATEDAWKNEFHHPPAS